MGRSPCCDHNSTTSTSTLKKGPWTEEEDDLLTTYIQKHGSKSWTVLPKKAGLNRCGKSCRLRWTNYLRPDIKRGRITQEEEDLIIKLHSVLGNKWSRIAAHLPGRTDNEIKNYWNTHVRKKLLQMGIDPVTHKPRTDHLNILANFSQIFRTPQNLDTFINPWEINNSLKQQSNNFAELAKLQVLQNIFQILNTNNSSSLPNIDQTIPFNYEIIPDNNNNNNDNNNNNNNICSSSLGFSSQALNQNVPRHVTSETYDGTLESFSKFNNYNNNNNYNKSSLNTFHETLNNESRLPQLITLSLEGNTNSTNGSSSLYTPVDGDGFFGGLEKVLDDGNSDFWKEFIK
ncbi:hypothetical protein vseg_020422 [Gypsophila vaccaria]